MKHGTVWLFETINTPTIIWNYIYCDRRFWPYLPLLYFEFIYNTFWTCVSSRVFTNSLQHSLLPVYGQLCALNSSLQGWSRDACTSEKITFLVGMRKTPNLNHHDIKCICANIATPTFSKGWLNKWKWVSAITSICYACTQLRSISGFDKT